MSKPLEVEDTLKSALGKDQDRDEAPGTRGGGLGLCWAGTVPRYPPSHGVRRGATEEVVGPTGFLSCPVV